jgi:hypothetical protein
MTSGHFYKFNYNYPWSVIEMFSTPPGY